MEVKHKTHPANTVEITDVQEDDNQNIHVYTDGNKSEHGVGSRIAISKDSKLIDTKNYKVNGRCSKKTSRTTGNNKSTRKLTIFGN